MPASVAREDTQSEADGVGGHQVADIKGGAEGPLPDTEEQRVQPVRVQEWV